MYLTPKQNEVFTFIERYIKKNNMSPTYDDIRKHFGFSSFNAVFKHVRQLEQKGVIAIRPNKKRAITLIEHGTPAVHVRILGNVAAGVPIDTIEDIETISVPHDILGNGENFGLRVKGHSMVGDGIHDGDVVIIHKRFYANDGETVVAMINNEVTLKRFYRTKQGVELRPSNPTMKPTKIKSGDFKILGVISGLIRRY